MRERQPLCRLEDIPDGGSESFVAEVNGEKQSLAVLRRGSSVWVYVNSCPHIGAPLDFKKGKFLNREETHIICANHGALFEVGDGMCVRGPCIGEALEAVPCVVRDDTIYIGQGKG